MNKNNEYKIKLPYRLSLPGNGWQVALSAISVPRPKPPVQWNRDALLKDIPANTNLVSCIIALYNGNTPIYRRTAWVTMAEVLADTGVVDSASFMRRLARLLERNIFEMYYDTKQPLRGYTLRHQTLSSPTYAGYPKVTWHEEGNYLEVDWHDTSRHQNLELSITRKFAELIGCVSWHDGDVVNEWYYGPELELYPITGGPMSDFSFITSSTSADLLGPIYYSDNGGFFGFRAHAKYRFFAKKNWFHTTTATHPDHGDSKLTMLYVYSNVGRGAILGDQITDLLRQVPVKHENAEGFIYYEPQNLQHVDVRSTDMDVIEIAIGKPEGGLAELGEGITTVTLHFRRLP